MASESSAGFHHHHHHHHHQQQQQQQSMLFKSGGAMSSSSSGSGGCELISMGNYYRSRGGSLNLSGNDGSGGGMIFSSGSAQNSLDSSSTLLLDSVPGLKHDTGLAAEWSIEEQYKLEEGLAKYANEPNIMRYIKIAATLRDKTVRDVALRCRWMTRKRRKQEDQSLGKKVKDRKEKLVESSLNNMSSASSVNMAPYSLTANHHRQTDCMLSGVLSGTTRHLLEENNQAFGQISANLSSLKLQHNIDLLFRTRNNLTSILNDMSNMPGIMSQMPPLPVLVNEELARSIFPPSSQRMMFSSSSATPLKQEPGC